MPKDQILKGRLLLSAQQQPESTCNDSQPLRHRSEANRARRSQTTRAPSVRSYGLFLGRNSRSVKNLDIADGTVAIFMAMILFFVPTRSQKARAESATLLDTRVFQKLTWGIILLFGGGFALAKGFQVTGLAEFLGGQLQLLDDFPPLLMVGLVSGSITFLTEVTSNTATTQMILPILAFLGVAMGENPLLLMIPATLSAPCVFMMPVATPPNAIVFGSGRVKIGDMVKAGFLINIIGVTVISLLFYFLGTAVFAIDTGVQPDWAKLTATP